MKDYETSYDYLVSHSILPQMVIVISLGFYNWLVENRKTFDLGKKLSNNIVYVDDTPYVFNIMSETDYKELCSNIS